MGRTDTETPARLPDESGYVERDGVRVWWDAYGTGDRALLLLPTWSIVHSRLWKAQIHYLARHFRVVTFDGRAGALRRRTVSARTVVWSGEPIWRSTNSPPARSRW